jgi:hypothetical protein
MASCSTSTATETSNRFRGQLPVPAWHFLRSIATVTAQSRAGVSSSATTPSLTPKTVSRALSMMARETNGGVLRGSVSEEDPLYEKLLLWTDGNHNGISEPEEWRPARDLFSDIGVGYRRCPGGRDESGNLFLYRGWAHIRIGCGADLERCGPALLTSEAVAGASGAEPRKRSCL